MAEERIFADRRRRMVRRLEERGALTSPAVREALLAVPRERFVDLHLRNDAYRDHALPIACGQTISRPEVVARMTELLEVEESHSVLEVGTGSGYQTAVLARLARRVYSLERVPELAREAIRRMRELKLDNVKIQVFDGSIGWSEVAPFDRILVAAGAPRAPRALLEQLARGGRLLVPEGDRQNQVLVVYDRLGERVRRREEGEAAFVPLIGKQGWQEEGP